MKQIQQDFPAFFLQRWAEMRDRLRATAHRLAAQVQEPLEETNVDRMAGADDAFPESAASFSAQRVES